jgi:hypothetical protein
MVLGMNNRFSLNRVVLEMKKPGEIFLRKMKMDLNLAALLRKKV